MHIQFNRWNHWEVTSLEVYYLLLVNHKENLDMQSVQEQISLLPDLVSPEMVSVKGDNIVTLIENICKLKTKIS